MPLHEHKPHHRKGLGALLGGISVSSAVTLGFALVLLNASIPITVILPTLAPIWIGITSIVFSVFRKH